MLYGVDPASTFRAIARIASEYKLTASFAGKISRNPTTRLRVPTPLRQSKLGDGDVQRPVRIDADDYIADGHSYRDLAYYSKETSITDGEKGQDFMSK